MKAYKSDDFVLLLRARFFAREELCLHYGLNCHFFVKIQLKSGQTERLLNKPYVNEVILKCYQPLEVLTYSCGPSLWYGY